MTPIKIIDATGNNLGQGGLHVELEYAAPDAEPSAFLGHIPGLGVLRGLICPDCGQVKLYGERRRNE